MSDQPAPDGDRPRKRKRRRRGGATGGASGSSASKASSARSSSKGGASKGASSRKGAGRSTSKAGQRSKDGKPAAAARSPVQREVSAGGVVYRRHGDEIDVVLASRRTRRGELAWGLAKGGIEPGESIEDAAVREVLEETGFRARIEASLGETRYFYVWEDTRIRKTVHFFLMRFVDGDPDDRDDEMEEIRWFPLDRARKRAAYRGERDVLGRAADHLRGGSET